MPQFKKYLGNIKVSSKNGQIKPRFLEEMEAEEPQKKKKRKNKKKSNPESPSVVVE